jgi:hypothetical protein
MDARRLRGGRPKQRPRSTLNSFSATDFRIEGVIVAYMLALLDRETTVCIVSRLLIALCGNDPSWGRDVLPSQSNLYPVPQIWVTVNSIFHKMMKGVFSEDQDSSNPVASPHGRTERLDSRRIG